MMFNRKKISEIRNIGFVSTRFAGTDGVSLETKKWAEVLGVDVQAFAKECVRSYETDAYFVAIYGKDVDRLL